MARPIADYQQPVSEPGVEEDVNQQPGEPRDSPAQMPYSSSSDLLESSLRYHAVLDRQGGTD